MGTKVDTDNTTYHPAASDGFKVIAPDRRLGAWGCYADWCQMRLLPNTMPEPNVEYYWKRTDSWKWVDGCECWWEVFIVFHDGMNGGGGAYVEERWRWSGSSQNIRVQPKNLTLDETRQLIAELSA